MRIQPIFFSAYEQVQRPMRFIALVAFCFLLSSSYPSDLSSYPILPAKTPIPSLVAVSEDYLRFIPTAVQVGLPLLLRDKIGMVQLLYVAVSTTVATHATKRILNDRYVMGTRLGQRPNRSNSNHNMPSGHSSMASCAVYFVARRYSFRLGLLLGIFMLLAMYARVMLNAHTVSAVIAGCLLGMWTSAFFTSRAGGATSAASLSKLGLNRVFLSYTPKK